MCKLPDHTTTLFKDHEEIFMSLCLYYQAKINLPLTWLFVAAIRSCEHMCFDRTIDVSQGTFEFFVPRDQEHDFLSFMQKMQQLSLVSGLQKLPNRLATHAVG